MNTKNLVLMSLLTAVGAALYLIIPPITGRNETRFHADDDVYQHIPVP